MCLKCHKETTDKEGLFEFCNMCTKKQVTVARKEATTFPNPEKAYENFMSEFYKMNGQYEEFKYVASPRIIVKGGDVTVICLRDCKFDLFKEIGQAVANVCPREGPPTKINIVRGELTASPTDKNTIEIRLQELRLGVQAPRRIATIRSLRTVHRNAGDSDIRLRTKLMSSLIVSYCISRIT